MQVVIKENDNAVAEVAAHWIKELIKMKSDSVLGLATGSTPIKLYQRLVAMHNEQGLSFKDVTTFNLDEYYNIDPSNPQSYRSFMQDNLFDHVDVNIANTYLPTCSAEQNPRQQGLAYEQKIKESGGIDLQILGIGGNGHIGFNEPTSSLVSRTRIKTLTKQTLVDNSRLFKPDEEQPQMAMTTGIGTIMDARYVILLATGKNKARAVRDMVMGPVSALCPASILQMHENVILIADKDAASELPDQEYFNWSNEQNDIVVERFGLFHNY